MCNVDPDTIRKHIEKTTYGSVEAEKEKANAPMVLKKERPVRLPQHLPPPNSSLDKHFKITRP